LKTGTWSPGNERALEPPLSGVRTASLAHRHEKHGTNR